MKSSTKWLIGFGSMIGVLVVAAIVLVLTIPGSDDTDLPPADTPEGVVMHYFKALEQEDFDTAYSYLSETALEENEWVKDDWAGRNYYYNDNSVWRVIVIETKETDSTATVEVEISTFSPGGVFSDPVDTFTEYFHLVNDDDDVWKIDDPLSIPWYIR